MPSDIVQKINKLVAIGDFAGAQKRIRPLAKKEPQNASLQNMAGLCHAGNGLNEKALPYFAAATKLGPQNFDFRCNLALCLILTRRIDYASTHVDRLLEMATQDSRPHYYKALLCEAQNDHDGVILHATRALQCAPEMTDALHLRATSLSGRNEVENALSDFRKIVSLKLDDIKARKALAKHLSEMGQKQAALMEYETVLAQDPKEPFSLSQVAMLCERERLTSLEEQIFLAEKRKPRALSERALLALARARLLDRSGDTLQAMKYYKQMNMLDAKDRPWKVRPGWEQFESLTKAFPSSVQIPADDNAPKPVFVVGLPRSGTTLVETILSGCPGVHSCGELTAADLNVRRLLDDGTEPTKGLMESIAESYRAQMPVLPPGTSTFTDKMPANFRYIGPLLEAFPNARVVNVRRDPRDVALSMWQRRFTQAGMNFTNRLEWIADQANLYRSYMRHWEESYPSQILSVHYEELVHNVEEVTRIMAEHCGLEWSENMLRPDQNQSRVQTASMWQVREKINHHSIGRWGLFGNDIKLLTDNLDSALWHELQ